LNCVTCGSSRERQGAAPQCFPEGFLQGRPIDERPARNAVDLALPALEAVLDGFPKTGANDRHGADQVEER
jgi:hypothetical protein